jgi:hypothetical protein
MFLINKKEAEIIRDRLPNAYITRTSKWKSGKHHYFCEESLAVTGLLSEIRSNVLKEAQSNE